VTPTAALAAAGVVAFAGIMMVVAEVASKPTVPFGVRVPPERTRAPSIIAARRVYTMRAVAVGACCTAAAFLLPGGTPWWMPRLILLLELAADVGCQKFARREITAVKRAEHWFAGRRVLTGPGRAASGGGTGQATANRPAARTGPGLSAPPVERAGPGSGCARGPDRRPDKTPRQ
jgi:hypothetical protein